MQQLKDKLAIAERAAKAEAQLKEKYQLRFKVLEERLKGYPNCINRTTSQGRNTSNGTLRRQSLGGSENLSRPNAILSRKGSLSASSRIINASSLLKQERDSSSSFESDGELSNGDRRVTDVNEKDSRLTNGKDTPSNGITHPCENGNRIILTEKLSNEYEDCVSGMLYDLLQKEVIAL